MRTTPTAAPVDLSAQNAVAGQELSKNIYDLVDIFYHWGRENASQIGHLSMLLAYHMSTDGKGMSYLKQLDHDRAEVERDLKSLTELVRERVGALKDRGAQNREREEEQHLPLDLARGDEEYPVPERERGGFER